MPRRILDGLWMTEGRRKTLKEAGQRGPLNKDADPTPIPRPFRE